MNERNKVGSVEMLLGDSYEVLKTLPDNYFSALITDPP